MLGFTGVLLIYRPTGDFSWKYHIVGLICGLSSALAYLSVSSLNRNYDTRVIVLSFLLNGVALPTIGMLIGAFTSIKHDEFFVTEFKLPQGIDWFYILGMAVTALAGQYFVTKAYGHDKAGIVSAIGYSNILFALTIGIILGDPLPNLISLLGIVLVIISGITISLTKK